MSNVIDTKEVSAEETQQEMARKKIDLLDTDRKNGLLKCDNALLALQDVTGVVADPDTENRLRQLESAARGLATATTALNALLDVLAHDFGQVIHAIERQNAVGMLHGAHVQALLNVLQAKGLVSEEDFKNEFQKLLPGLRQTMSGQ